MVRLESFQCSQQYHIARENSTKQRPVTSKERLELCALICKIQVQKGRHSMESPGTSDVWKQVELASMMVLTKTAQLDQCRFSLVHPEDHRPLKMYTRLQTTSNHIVRDLDGRMCRKDQHTQVAGSFKFQNQKFAYRLAAFYPRLPSEVPSFEENVQ